MFHASTRQDGGDWKPKRRFHVSFATWACVLFLCSCIVVPMKTPTLIKNSAGEKVPLPHDALIAGVTTREQVEQQYKSFAVDCGTPHLFWGRFQKSTWAMAGGMFGAGAGASRMWGGFNLLATFDDNGILKYSETLPDKELVSRFVTMRKQLIFPALEQGQPIDVTGTPEFPWLPPAEFQLSATEILVSMDRQVSAKKQKHVSLAIPIAQVLSVQLGSTGEDKGDIHVELLLSEKTAFGKHIHFQAKPEGALTLVRWLEQVKAR
jgi:hypothetical protein